MSEYEFPWWAVSVLLTGSLTIYAWIKIRLAEVNIATLEEQVKVFSEASVEVARAVQHSVQTSVQNQRVEKPVENPPPQRSSSRRYLLREARSDLSSGQDMSEVKSRFALQQDEVFLLSRMTGSDS